LTSTNGSSGQREVIAVKHRLNTGTSRPDNIQTPGAQPGGCAPTFIIKEKSMNDIYLPHFYSAESVTDGHPDKLCDQIADAVLDACLANDANSRVACEVMATKGHIILAGEISTALMPDVANLTREVLLS